MKDILVVFAEILTISVVVLLCFFSCILANKSDEYWEKLKREKKKNERR